jgi:integrase
VLTRLPTLTNRQIKDVTPAAWAKPWQMTKLLHNAPQHLVPIYAIGGFAGLRLAELARLSWHAVDLDRGLIELRADQAKTASRRIINNPQAGLSGFLTSGPVQRIRGVGMS